MPRRRAHNNRKLPSDNLLVNIGVRQKKSHAKFAEFRKGYAVKLCSSLMEDYAETYFASLVCSRPSGKAQA